ncbi:MAG: helix-turn-helix domain-containing protein [Candidatus Daviesbacteria bacterium]|nr:helix-turn-helix domain-containing protein [Candidatus Daviesbacteria bacterium]
MRTVGQVLKETREAKFYTLDEIEKATKIRKELLQALEEDDWDKLPPPTFVQGFIKNYARFLGLDVEKLLAIFRREFSDKKNPPKILQAWTNPLDKKRLRLTPGKVLSGVVIGIVLAFLIYLWFEYRFLVGSPFLEITSPNNQAVVNTESVKVIGKTDAESKVMINNQEVPVDVSGNFSEELKLTDPANDITISAISKYGKSTTETRTVFLKQ